MINLYSPENNRLLESNQEIIQRLIPLSVAKYYELLLSHEETAKFLSHELIENRLKSALAQWLSEVLSPKSPDEFEATVQRQYEIGEIHARINVNMGLVSQAMITLKTCFHKGIIQDPNTDPNVALTIHTILDTALININGIYFHNNSRIEHQQQALKIHLSNSDFALEIEQMRNNLVEWYSDGLFNRNFSPLNESDFALWVKYKLSMACSSPEIIDAMTDKIDLVSKITTPPNSLDADKAQQLNQIIKEISWQLSEQSRKLMLTAVRKDPLTRLYNRRFLEPILIQETQRSLKYKLNYSIVMIDVDYFKRINDTYGHDMGDKVLVKFGQVIEQNIRMSDFAFRYGGEEFLIVLSECSKHKAYDITNRIAQDLSKYCFTVNETESFFMHFSAGIAEYDALPDYQHTLKRADQALYFSKENGRNQITLA